MQSGNQLAEKLLASQLPSNTASGANDASSSVKPTRPVSTVVTKQSTADITSMSLASLFENTESGQFGLGFGSGGLLGLRGAMPKMPSFRVCFCCESVLRKSLSAMHQIYKHIILYIFNRRLLLNSGLRCRFTEWPAGTAGSVLACEVNGRGSSPTRAIFWLHFTFNLIVAFRGSVKVSRVTVQDLG